MYDSVIFYEWRNELGLVWLADNVDTLDGQYPSSSLRLRTQFQSLAGLARRSLFYSSRSSRQSYDADKNVKDLKMASQEVTGTEGQDLVMQPLCSGQESLLPVDSIPWKLSSF